MKNTKIFEHEVDIVNARTDFYFFARYMFRQQYGYNWQRAQHHQQICDALMRVYNGECTRLIINIPPRYSKTMLAIVSFMAWTIGREPDSEFIHTTYSSDLATYNSFLTKDMVQHPAYREIFPGTVIRSDSKAKSEWRTTARGCVYAVGGEGSITGYGAGKQRDGFGGAILIDDPHKADEAGSKIMRQNVINRFQNTLESRKNNPMTTPIIVVMQRLDVADLTGFLLNGGNGEKWEHLCLPAIQPDGSALWPEKHSLEKLRQMRDANEFVFAGQYQQQPFILSGNFFKPDNIRIIDFVPANRQINWVRAWDFGATMDGDYTVGVKMGMCDGRPVIADMVRGQWEPDGVNKVLLATAQRDGYTTKIRLPQDPGQAGKQQVSFWAKMLSGYNFTASPVTGDKVTRATPFASQVNAGNVDMVRANWNDALVDELRPFNSAPHDDIVDALSDAYAEMATSNLDVWLNII